MTIEKTEVTLENGAPLRDTLMRSLLLVVVWLVLWRIAGILEYAPHASIWYPPAALTLAAFVVMGRAAWPAVVIVVVASSWWIVQIHPLPLTPLAFVLSSIGFIVSHGISYFLGALNMRHLLGSASARPVHATLAWFLLIAAVAALGSALLGTLVVVLMGGIGWSEYAVVAATWWFGDLAAVVVLTPVFIALVGWRYTRVAVGLSSVKLDFGQSSRRWFLLKLFTVVACFSALMGILLWMDRQFQVDYVGFIVLLCLIPQLWIVFTEPPIRTAISLSVLFLGVALFVLFADISDYVLFIQVSLLMVALISWSALLIPMLYDENAKLSSLANTDQLTGAQLRHAFVTSAERRINHAQQAEHALPLILIMLDIDHFKQVNDTYGHAVGDQALQQVAQVVRGAIREDDLFGRFGGDEFLLLIQGSIEHAEQLTSRLQTQVQQQVLADHGNTLSLSFGVTVVQPQDSTLAAVSRADALLFKAKRNGRARAVMA